jgi:5-methylcytosine-specific restriction endonuclease McrA
MDYELMVYICEGTSSEKLEWFEIVNKAGKELTRQELRNKSYTGSWLSDAKLHFSKRNCAAKGLSDRYVKGDPNRQELLEKALMWIADAQNTTIDEYMSNHQHDCDADELWQYFQDIIHWIEKIFPDYYPQMKGLDWGILYNKHHNKTYNSSTMRSEVKRLMKDDEVQKRAKIFEYLLIRDEDPYAGKILDLRVFDDKDKQRKYYEQGKKCPICGKTFEYSEMRGDHIKPWSKGGRTEYDNLQMLCADCNGKKSDKY